MGALLYLLLILGLPAAILLIAGIWLVRENRSTAHHLTGVIGIVLGLLLLSFSAVLVPSIPVSVTSEGGVTPIPMPSPIPSPSPTPTSGGGN